MPDMEKFKAFLHRKKRDFTAKRGRLGRSRFFADAFIVAVLVFIYSAALRSMVLLIDSMDGPRLIYGNVYFIGVGVLFLGIAFFTRPLRLKRMRDMGMPVWADWPFFILLIAHGLGPIFQVIGIPYLEAVEVISMPENVRDLFGIIWLVWLLVLMLGPSKRSNDPFVNGMCKAQEKR